MVEALGFSTEEIRQSVRDMYTVVAEQPDPPLHFPIGGNACKLAGYTAEQISGVPESTLKSFAGVGCPFRAEVIQPGQRVLDVGSGSGTDVLVSARMVGEKGRVFALDMTTAMRKKLKSTVEELGIENVEVLEGDAESIPLPDASVDIVTSNGVLNLVPDKRRAIAEIFRVLKPGGYAQIADIVIASPVTPDCEDDPALWAECVVGATVDENYLNMFRDAGFDDVEILRDYDYFSYSPSRETREVARQFGAHAFELKMRRGATEPAKVLQWMKRANPARLARNIQRRGLWGTASLIMAMMACYGTLARVALLSVMGIGLVVDEGLWAGAILIFAGVSLAVIGAGMRKHHSFTPLLVALPGFALLVWVMLVDYSRLLELAGFVLLALAAWFDFDLRRWSKVRGREERFQADQRSEPELA